MKITKSTRNVAETKIPDELESITTEDITCNDDWDIDWDKLWEISDRYVGDTPLSGDWSTELIHEQKAISDELGVSMDTAKQLMIDHLEIPPEIFEYPLIAADEDVDAEDEIGVSEEIDVDRVEDEPEPDDYIENLKDSVISATQELFPDVTIQFDYNDIAMLFTITTQDDLGEADIITYEVPLEDLKYNLTTDRDYIIDAINEAEDTE